MLKLLRRKSNGFTLIELLIVVAIIGILAAIAIPNLLSARRRANYSRSASDTKTAVTQGVVYQNDYGFSPGDLSNLRVAGYANVPTNDPWTTPYVVSTGFSTMTPPVVNQIHVCSLGANPGAPAGTPCGVGDFTGAPLPDPNAHTQDGTVGYSATYGSWMGQ